MKNLILITIATLFVTLQSCKKSEKDCVGCGGQQPQGSTDCVTINTIIANNDTTIVNTKIGDSLFTTIVIKHTIDTLVNKVCDGVAQSATNHGPAWTDTFNQFNGVTTGGNTSGGGTGGVNGLWMLNAASLGTTSSNWVSDIGAIQVIETANCWKRQSAAIQLNLNYDTWSILHNYAVTSYSYGIIVMVTGKTFDGFDAVTIYQNVPSSGNICQ